MLESGRLWGCDPKKPDRAVCTTYEKEVDTGGYTRVVRQPGLFDQARALVPQLRQHTSDAELGHFLSNRGCSNEKKVMRRQGWTFPALLACRAEWQARFPGWRWRNEKIFAWQPELADDAPETAAEMVMEAMNMEASANQMREAAKVLERQEKEAGRSSKRARKGGQKGAKSGPNDTQNSPRNKAQTTF